MSVYLVTGGAGFIGSHIVEELLRRGERVRVLDNFFTGKRENLDFSLLINRSIAQSLEIIEGDIRDLKKVEEVIKDVDYVIHVAALRSVPKSMDDPVSYHEVNVTGTLNILLAAREEKIKKVVFASSSSVYGETKRLPEKEKLPPQPISPYALTKLTGEYYCKVFSKAYGLKTVSLRYFNVFGPRQSLESQYAVVIPKFITCMLKNEPPPIHGDGLQSRDFTYVANVVKATIQAATVPNLDGEVLNVACGEAYTVLDIVKYVNQILGKNIQPIYNPPRPGDVKHTLADISLMQKKLGSGSNVNFLEGLKRTIEYFKKTIREVE
ncbi:MAG TPA: LPS biosynthesis protein WbpP [Elusimicrobia bacterium]|jgi:nucleoside-diphosphate-sugar epimerase|nr:LPS biosynthesis protein WbpP [Elusimicrobiota bacterium]